MKTLVEKSVIAIILSVALTGFKSPAFAEGPSKKISYADLNLEQPSDVTILYERIQAAAEKVAQVGGDPRGWWTSPPVQETRGQFVQRYALGRKNWLKCWGKVLEEEAALGPER